MARIQGIIGTGSGRLGQAVLSKGDNGQTVARTYQDQVRNPRTVEQRKQRAKMNLAGQLSKLTPASALTGMYRGNGRGARAAFVHNVIDACTVSDNGAGESIATIIPAKLTFAQGNLSLMGGILPYFVTEGDDFGYHETPIINFQRVYTSFDLSEIESLVSFKFEWVGTDATPHVTYQQLLEALTPKGIYGEQINIIIFRNGQLFNVSNSARLFYGSNFQESYTGIEYRYLRFNVALGFAVEIGDELLIYRTPFVIDEGATSMHVEDTEINGINIQAAIGKRKNISDLLSEYNLFQMIPPAIVTQLCQSKSTKWGKSSFVQKIIIEPTEP